MADLITYDRADKAAILTFNRPDKLNALNYATNDLLLSMLDELEGDDSVKVIILTGAGNKAFSAGADIHEFSQTIEKSADDAVREFVQRGQRMTARLEAYPKPVIAAVNGLAYGGGCEITEAVPLALASERAIFAKPEINIGIPPTFGGTQRLPRLAGRKRALEFLLTGDPFTPDQALAMGLINRIVPHDMLMEEALALAARITRHSSLAAARILSAVTRGLNCSIADGLLIEQEQFARMAVTEDTGEALKAWKERRVPIYTGR